MKVDEDAQINEEDGLPHIPHNMVAYALGLKPSLVYNVRSGRRSDCHGIEKFVESLQHSLSQTREQHLQLRERTKHPVLVANDPKA